MDADAIVVGGGYYGCCLGLFLAAEGQRVILLERAGELLGRASYANQARVHNGYHYPRNLITGLRSCANFPRFVLDFRSAVVDGFEKIYAIARRNSKVTASQFHAFCRRIGAPIHEASPTVLGLFDRDLIEAAFIVKEIAFDAGKLREILQRRLYEEGVEVRMGREVSRVAAARGGVELELRSGERLRAPQVVLCAYSQINTLLTASDLPRLPMKHEIAEIALVEPPKVLAEMGITVMDGPFFSTMPFPHRGLHSFTHVRYTPHEAWNDEVAFADAYFQLERYRKRTRYPEMMRDAQRYLPAAALARYVESLFEVKTVLLQNESNDGRPILFRRDYGIPGLSVVMGGKIDNIYDILRAMRGLSDGARAVAAGEPESLFSRLVRTKEKA